MWYLAPVVRLLLDFYHGPTQYLPLHCKLWLLQDKWNVSHAATLIDVSGIIVVHALATCGTKHQFWKYPLVFLLQNVPLFKAILEVKYEALFCYPLFESFFSYSPQPEAMFVL